MTTLSLEQSSKLLTQGNVIAYPTEAVFGLGCDPDNESAVHNILALKNRPIEKGLILVAANLNQLIPYIDESSLTDQQKEWIVSIRPTAVTWVVPKHKTTPYFLTGQFDSLAIRVTTHPLVRKLCETFNKPIVSTSANLSGLEPCRTITEVETQFGINFPVLYGELGTQINPSEIRDIKTKQIIRHG